MSFFIRISPLNGKVVDVISSSSECRRELMLGKMRLFYNFRNRLRKKSHKIIIPAWENADGALSAEPRYCPKREEFETLFVSELRIGKAPEKYFKNYCRKKRIAAHKARKKKLSRRETKM